jgi:hypothetical protein
VWARRTPPAPRVTRRGHALGVQGRACGPAPGQGSPSRSPDTFCQSMRPCPAMGCRHPSHCVDPVPALLRGMALERGGSMTAVVAFARTGTSCCRTSPPATCPARTAKMGAIHHKVHCLLSNSQIRQVQRLGTAVQGGVVGDCKVATSQAEDGADQSPRSGAGPSGTPPAASANTGSGGHGGIQDLDMEAPPLLRPTLVSNQPVRAARCAGWQP